MVAAQQGAMLHSVISLERPLRGLKALQGFFAMKSLEICLGLDYQFSFSATNTPEKALSLL